MPLERARKVIPLYGGHAEDVDTLQVKSPAMHYVENMHWRNKEGVLQKRLGEYQSTMTGEPTATVNPTVLHPLGDNLVTFADGKSYTYSPTDDEWVESDQLDTFVSTQRLAQSEVAGGLYGHTFFEFENGETIFIYGLDDAAPGTDGTSRAIVRDSNGVIRTDQRLFGSWPVIVPSTVNNCVVWLMTQGGLVWYTYIRSSRSIGGQFIADSNIWTDYKWNTGDNVAESIVDVKDFIPSYVVTTPHQHVEIASPTNKYYEDSGYVNGGTVDHHNLLAYANNNGNLELLKADTGSTGFSHPPLFGGDIHYPLGIADAPPSQGNRFYLLSNEHSVDPGGVNEVNHLRIRRYDYDESDHLNTNADAQMLTTIVPGSTPFPASGGLTVHPTTAEVYAAVYAPSASGTDKIWLSKHNAALSGTPDTNELFNYRLTSNLIAVDRAGDGSDYRILVAAQMSSRGNITRAGADDDTPDSFASWRRPTTNCILDITDVDEPTVLAIVDANQSKHSDFTDLRNNQMLGQLCFNEDYTGVILSTREIFDAEGPLSRYNADGNLYEDAGVDARARANVYEFKFTQTLPQRGVAFGDGLLLSGGAQLWYDGKTLRESSPINPPTILSVGYDSVASGANTPALMCDEIKVGYQTQSGRSAAETDWRTVQAVCGYTDAKGNVHRSAPSAKMFVLDWVPGPKTISAYEQGFDAYVNLSLPLTMNFGDRAQTFFAEVYVSDSNTGPPKLAARVPYTPDGAVLQVRFQQNAFTGTSPTFNANNTAPVVRYTSPIYTTGGTLAADVWPNMREMVVTSTRLFGLSAEDSGVVFYSKRFQELTAPEFNAALTISLGDERDLTAIGKVDDKVVVFEANDIHVIYGPGPDNTGKAGRGGGFEIHQLSTDVGCTQPASVVETPMGLIFKSVRGFHLLDRAMKLHFIGGPVYDMAYNATVKSASLVPEWGEVRFIMETRASGTYVDKFRNVDGDYRPPPIAAQAANELPSNACLVFNYEFNRWSVFTGYAGEVSAVTNTNRVARIRSDWSIAYEARPEDDHWLDADNADIVQVMQTPWIPLTDTPQGYARLRSATLLGKYLSSFDADIAGDIMAGDIFIEAMYDYEERVYRHDKLWRANVELAGPDTLGTDNRQADRLQIRFRPQARKCQAIKFRISSVASTPFYVGEGPEWSVDLGEIIDVRKNPDPATYAIGRGFEMSSIELDLAVKVGPVKSLGAPRKQ